MDIEQLRHLNKFITCLYAMKLSEIILYYYETDPYCPKDTVYIVPRGRLKRLR